MRGASINNNYIFFYESYMKNNVIMLFFSLANLHSVSCTYYVLFGKNG